MRARLRDGVMRRMREGTRIVRHGEWKGWGPTGMLGRSLGGKTLGIIGMGRIGQAVAHRARAFGMQVMFAAHKGVSGLGPLYTLTGSSLGGATVVPLISAFVPRRIVKRATVDV